MTLRAFYALCGMATWAPALGYLILFRPPYSPVWRRFRRVERSGSTWVATALRLLAFSVVCTGLRLMISNMVNGNLPLVYRGWFDKFTTLFTVILGAVASILFFVIYLVVRSWPRDDEDL
jgi:hypothetical protein